MVEMKTRDGDRLRIIIKKGLKTNEVFDRIELAKRSKVVKDVLEDLDVAREPSEEMKAYSRQENEIYAKFGTMITTQDGNTGYRIEDWKPVTEALEKLQAENSDIVEADKKAKADIAKLMDKEIDIDIDPMKNEWFGKFIDGDDAEFLLEHDLLDLGGDGGDEKVSDIRPKKRSARGKRSKRR